MAIAELTSVWFSTAVVPEKERLALFTEEVARKLLSVEFVNRSEDMRFDFDFQHYGRVLAGRADGTCGDFVRTRTSAGSTPECFTLLIGARGSFRYSARKREAFLGRGEAVLINHGEVGVMQALSSGTSTSIMVDRSALLALLPRADDLVGLALPRATPVLKLLTDYLASARGVAAGGMGGTAELVGEHVLQLMAHAIADGTDGRTVAESDGIRAARLAEILADIEDNAVQPDYSIILVASRLGITPRYVQRLLEPTGQSFTEHVRERRLQRAHALLIDPHHAHLRVTDIALDAGFGDIPYFNRAFRSRFGDAPSAIRAAAMAGWPKGR